MVYYETAINNNTRIKTPKPIIICTHRDNNAQQYVREDISEEEENFSADSAL